MRHASGHNYRNSSFIVDVAMGQIPRSTERISSQIRDKFCGTWYLPHSQVHSERTGDYNYGRMHCAWRNGHISTSALKSDVTMVFLDPDFLEDAKISAIRVHLRHT